MSQTPKKIAIVGSGLVGSLLAIYLKKLGHTVLVYDRRSDIRKTKFSGRSINLAMSVRGWKALQEAGIAEEIKKIAIPMHKRAIHMQGKPVYFQPYGQEGEAIYSISRGILNRTMIDLAESEGVQFVFNSKVWDIDILNATLAIGEADKNTWKYKKYDLIFGADGAFSRIRHKMQRRSRFDYSQKFLPIGYKELRILPRATGKHKLDKHSLHIWPRNEFMFIALPNLDGSFTCTLFMPFEGRISFASLDSEDKVRIFFKTYFPSVIEEMHNLTQDFFKNPTSTLVTIKCFPWTYWDKVALIGDAAHAIVPFYGQGMNAGFEDITVLSSLIHRHKEDWQTIFQQYENQRKPNTDAIAELSYQNFVEMSTKTADKMFLLRKKIERKFTLQYPEKWMPLYSRVTFSEKPYAEALSIGKKQNKIMDEIMKISDIETLWDTQEIMNKILKLL